MTKELWLLIIGFAVGSAFGFFIGLACRDVLAKYWRDEPNDRIIVHEDGSSWRKR